MMQANIAGIGKQKKGKGFPTKKKRRRYQIEAGIIKYPAKVVKFDADHRNL